MMRRRRNRWPIILGGRTREIRQGFRKFIYLGIDNEEIGGVWVLLIKWFAFSFMISHAIDVCRPIDDDDDGG